MIERYYFLPQLIFLRSGQGIEQEGINIVITTVGLGEGEERIKIWRGEG